MEVYCLQKLKINHNCTPLFYCRYVDDTILCVHKNHLDLIIKTFNSYYSNLQFTFELEHNNRIHFLDMTLIRHHNCIITDWFQKPSSSGRMINSLASLSAPRARDSIVALRARSCALRIHLSLFLII